jgi:hypothetical protein
MAKKWTTDGLTTRLAMQFCPVCFIVLDAATSMTGKSEPAPDDFTVCVGCASVLRFDDGLVLHPSSLMEIPAHSRMHFAQLVQAVHARNNKVF